MDAYAGLEKYIGKPETAQPPKKKGDTTPPKTEAGKEDEKTEAPEGEKPKGEAKPDAAPPKKPDETPGDKKPMKAANLREAYDREKARRIELEKQLANPKPVDMKNHPEVVKLTEQLRKLEEQRDALDQEVRYSRYEAHPEYKERYLKPFEEAYNEGAAWATRLTVTDENGNERKATEQDFEAVMKLYASDPVAGTKRIKEMFGDMDSSVIIRAQEILRLNSTRLRALEDYKKNGSEREKQHAELTEKQQRELSELFAKERDSGTERFPQWFKPIDGDEEGNTKLERGMALADATFLGTPLKDQNGKVISMTPQQRAKLDAANRNKAGAFDRAIYLLAKEQGRVKELEEKLKQYEESEPGPGDRKGKPTEPKDMWSKIDADLLSRAR